MPWRCGDEETAISSAKPCRASGTAKRGAEYAIFVKVKRSVRILALALLSLAVGSASVPSRMPEAECAVRGCEMGCGAARHQALKPSCCGALAGFGVSDAEHAAQRWATGPGPECRCMRALPIGVPAITEPVPLPAAHVDCTAASLVVFIPFVARVPVPFASDSSPPSAASHRQPSLRAPPITS